MIDWDRTKSEFNRSNLSGRYPRVATTCDKCGSTGSVTIRDKKRIIDNQLPWMCKTCHNNKPAHRAALVESSSKQWQDPSYRNKVISSNRITKSSIEYHQKASEISKALHSNPTYKSNHTQSCTSQEFRHKMSIIASRRAQDPAYCKQLRQNALRLWNDTDFRNKELERRNSPEERARLSQMVLGLWRDQSYRDRVLSALEGVDNSTIAKRYWENPEYRAKVIESCKAAWDDPEHRLKMAKIYEEIWSNPERRLKASEASRKLWENAEYRQKMHEIHISEQWLEKIARNRLAQPRISSIQIILYSLLDDLGIKHYREYPDRPADSQCKIGPYTFDCVIPRDGKSTLLIECQGDYWHSTEIGVKRDRSKASYITNNFPGQYELKYIWEHEFKNYNKVVELLKYWLGITSIELVEFGFGDIDIQPCKAADYRLLLSKYHYLLNAGRGGIAYGAYHNDILIAVCIFSPLSRQNIASALGCANDEVRDLSRFCINPKYQKKNFGSWFISKCLKLLPKQYKKVISYCDTTFNHDGALYKACNFRLDGETAPDYWYAGEDGWVMHKKTLYNHAIVMGMTESDYAASMDYAKVWGDKKLRFIYDRFI